MRTRVWVLRIHTKPSVVICACHLCSYVGRWGRNRSPGSLGASWPLIHTSKEDTTSNREKREDPYWGCPLTSPCVSRPMCAYTHTWTHTQLSFKVSKAGIGCLLCRPRKQWLMGHLEGSVQFTWYSPKALLVKTKSFEHISPPCCATFGSWPHFRIIISWGYEILTNHLFSLLNSTPRTHDGFFCILWSSGTPTHPCSGSIFEPTSPQEKRVSFFCKNKG